MKKTGSLILSGLIPVLILFLFMKLVSLNLSYSFLVGVITLLLVSIWQRNNPKNQLLKIILISFPLLLVYYLLIVKEIFGLWIVLPFFLLGVIIGLFNSNLKLRLTAGVGILIVSTLVSFIYIPKIVSNNLSENIYVESPTYTLKNLLIAENITQNTNLGKVVLLDFFGTWCAPCIAEMKELESIQKQLSNHDNEFLFMIVCTDTGGDTPEKAIEFHSKRELPFYLAYDYKSETHQKFGFTGVPGLVIIDKKGNMRFKHEGYNQAENLESLLLPILERLLKE